MFARRSHVCEIILNTGVKFRKRFRLKIVFLAMAAILFSIGNHFKFGNDKNDDSFDYGTFISFKYCVYNWY